MRQHCLHGQAAAWHMSVWALCECTETEQSGVPDILHRRTACEGTALYSVVALVGPPIDV